MTKLYLLKSDHTDKEENSGDVIIDLNKVYTLKIIKIEEGFLLCADYTHEDAAKAIFDTLEKARNELQRILTYMNADSALAKEITPIKRKKTDERIHDVIRALRR